MPRFKRGIQYAVTPALHASSASGYWIARSSRAMTAMGRRYLARATFGIFTTRSLSLSSA